MAKAPITHLKLFLDQGDRQVALFSGPNESSQWLRNVPADEALQSGWHLLPQETLITVESLQQQGFLAEGLIQPSGEQASMAWAWAMRAAALAAQQAERATAAHDDDAEAESCSRVVRFLEQAGSHSTAPAAHDDIVQKRAAWLVRGVNARLTAWNANPQAEHAEALAELFEALSREGWGAAQADRDTARQNQLFWARKAAAAWGQASQQAEQNGDLTRAEAGAAAVVRLLSTLAA